MWDFPLVNIAAALKVSNGTIQGSRIVVNAVAAHPMRLKSVEDAVAGKPRNEETATMAGELAVQGARPLAHNEYKIPLDEEPGETRHQGRGTGIARTSWCSGASTPGARTRSSTRSGAWSTWRSRLASGFMLAHTLFVKFWPKPAGPATAPVNEAAAAKVPERVTRHSLAARMFHWIMAASMLTLLGTAVGADPRAQVQLGGDPLDRRPRPHGVDPLPHHPRELLAGLLVDLAEQGRCERGDHAVEARDGPERAGAAQGREISVGQQDVSHGHRAVGAGRRADRAVHDEARARRRSSCAIRICSATPRGA